MSASIKRELAAVMFTDIVGFTALMQQDEALTRLMRDRHRQVLETTHQNFHGKIIQYFGDGSLSIFKSAVEATACAVEIQKRLQIEEPVKVDLRIGLHLGDIVFEHESVFGDGVNIASRIESFSIPGAVMISDSLYEQIKKPRYNFKCCSLGKFQLKNVERPVEIFALSNDGLMIPSPEDLKGKGEIFDEYEERLHNLPQKLSSFVGRQKEIEDIEVLLVNNRLVTLTGPGGTGKSRLALQLAEKVAPHFPDGIFWIPLSAILDHSLVAFTIAKHLKLDQDPLLSIEEVMINFLHSKKLLLLLDNFEQIVGAAPLVERMLSQCPNLKVLASSRIVLQIIGEVEYSVKPLPLPKNGTSGIALLKGYPAINLFCQRAQSTRNRFELNQENAPFVTEICTRLDGLPLAIELAAARIKIFSPKAMLKRLDQRLDLKSNSTSLPERHRTIRQTIAWSFDLLDVEEKELFSRMSVFVGGANMEAIEEICGTNGLGGWEVVDGVLALVDKSLVQQEEKDDMEIRFFMLETIREFATDNLRKSEKDQQFKYAHAQFFLQMAEEAAPQLSGSEQSEWLSVLEVEQENFRAALHYCLQVEKFEMAFRLGLALRPFWGNRGMTMEGVQQLEKLLAIPSSEDHYPLRLKLMQALGVFVLLYSEVSQSQGNVFRMP